eukprot:364821-Chlamydomonas_euryale.AAC.16
MPSPSAHLPRWHRARRCLNAFPAAASRLRGWGFCARSLAAMRPHKKCGCFGHPYFVCLVPGARRPVDGRPSLLGSHMASHQDHQCHIPGERGKAPCGHECHIQRRLIRPLGHIQRVFIGHWGTALGRWWTTIWAFRGGHSLLGVGEYMQDLEISSLSGSSLQRGCESPFQCGLEMRASHRPEVWKQGEEVSTDAWPAPHARATAHFFTFLVAVPNCRIFGHCGQGEREGRGAVVIPKHRCPVSSQLPFPSFVAFLVPCPGIPAFPVLLSGLFALFPSFVSCLWSLRWGMSGKTPSDPLGWRRLSYSGTGLVRQSKLPESTVMKACACSEACGRVVRCQRARRTRPNTYAGMGDFTCVPAAYEMGVAARRPVPTLPSTLALLCPSEGYRPRENSWTRRRRCCARAHRHHGAPAKEGAAGHGEEGCQLGGDTVGSA